MEIILSKSCESFTGSLGKGFGYYIRRYGTRFYGQRHSYKAPPDGHWRFILACADLAKYNLHITDIKIKKKEVFVALFEMGRGDYLWLSRYPDVMNASDVINLKNELGL